MQYILTQEELDELKSKTAAQVAKVEAQAELSRVKQDLADALTLAITDSNLHPHVRQGIIAIVKPVFIKHQIKTT